jgi:hypothetical protein
MNLASIASKAAKVAFGVAGSALEEATLHIGQTQTQDFHTDTVSGSGGTEKETKGAFYHSRQQQDLAITNEAIFMILGEDVPDGIDEADTLTFTSGPRTGQTWQIYAVESIPTQAVWLLSIRK